MTSENSGLLSDVVYDIDFDYDSGQIYFSTDLGISIFKSPFSNISYNQNDSHSK